MGSSCSTLRNDVAVGTITLQDCSISMTTAGLMLSYRSRSSTIETPPCASNRFELSVPALSPGVGNTRFDSSNAPDAASPEAEGRLSGGTMCSESIAVPCERLVMPSACEWSHSELPPIVHELVEESTSAERNDRLFATNLFATTNPFATSTMSTVSTSIPSVPDPCMYQLNNGDSWKTSEGCPLSPALVANVLCRAAML